MKALAHDVTLTNLVNAMGGLFFVIAGLFVLVVGRKARRAVLVGALATLFGVAYTEGNLGLLYHWLSAWPFVVSALVASCFATLLALDLARQSSPRWRRRSLVAAIIALAYLVILLVMRADDWSLRSLASVAAILSIRASLMLVVFAAGGYVRSIPPLDASLRRGWTRLALGFGLWPVFHFFTYFAPVVRHPSVISPAVLALHMVPVLAVLVFLPDRTRPEHRELRLAFWGFIGVAAAGLGVGIHMAEQGVGDSPAFGIVRTIGAALVALAVVQDNVLRLQLPKLAVRKGTVGTAALAALFIVAQVGQNLLNAALGLIAGGVIAGAVLLAAHVIQRRMERPGRPEQGEGPPGGPDVDEAFRSAVRFALRDRRVTAQEELELADLAERLGIGNRRAAELRLEVVEELRRTRGGFIISSGRS